MRFKTPPLTQGGRHWLRRRIAVPPARSVRSGESWREPTSITSSPAGRLREPAARSRTCWAIRCRRAGGRRSICVSTNSSCRIREGWVAGRDCSLRDGCPIPSWEFVVTASDYPNGFAIAATGDFTGRCLDVPAEWFVRRHHLRLADCRGKPLFQRSSFLLRPLFEANHRWAMTQGETSLKLNRAPALYRTRCAPGSRRRPARSPMLRRAAGGAAVGRWRHLLDVRMPPAL